LNPVKLTETHRYSYYKILDPNWSVKVKTIIASVLAVLVVCSCGKPDQVPSPPVNAAPKVHEITGQVFVVTQGRENIKLALVGVGVLTGRSVMEHIKEKKKLAADQVLALSPALEVAKSAASSAAGKVGAAKQTVQKNAKLSDDSIAKPSHEEHFRILEISEDELGSAQKAAGQKQSAFLKLKNQIDYYSSPEYFFDHSPAAISTAKTDADGKFSLALPPGKYVLFASATRSILTTSETYHWLVKVDTTAGNQQIMLSNDNLYQTICEACIHPSTSQ
jgi:hypothetical protein